MVLGFSLIIKLLLNRMLLILLFWFRIWKLVSVVVFVVVMDFMEWWVLKNIDIC